MKIEFENPEFKYAIDKPSQLRELMDKIDTLPSVTFCGRSNAGKSTFLNYITQSKSLSRVSQTPGRTQSILVFEAKVGPAHRKRPLILIDLPGYGFAKVPSSFKKKWDELMRTFFESSPRIFQNYLIVDSRRGLNELDCMMLDYFNLNSGSKFIIFSKWDKLKNQKEKSAAKKKIEAQIASLQGNQSNLAWLTYSSEQKAHYGPLITQLYEKLSEFEKSDQESEGSFD